MDYELLLNGLEDIDDYVQQIYEFFNCNIKTDIIMKEDYIALTNNFLTTLINIDEIIGLDVIKEEFNFDANISLNIQVFHKTLEEGMNILFKLIAFLSTIDLKILLLEGGSEVLKRIEGEFEINSNKKEENYFPFYLLK